MSFKKVLILLFFLFSLTSQRLRGFQVPGKDSFKPINHGSPTMIQLTNSQKELYYSFDNQFDSSDIVIYAKNARQYTTSMYFYDSYESIKTDKDGEYINFVQELDLSEKLNYITSSKKCTYYIIIKDAGGYATKDYITVFNEKDTLELKEEEPFLIPMFFKNNLYTFSFEGEQDDKIYLDININDKSFSESIIIYRDDVEILRAVKNQGTLALNTEKKKGTYKVYLLSTDNKIYTNIKASIALRKSKSDVRLLEPEKEINVYYVNSNDFFFYVDLNNYELNEENIITFKISHNAYRNKLLQYCYAKNINFEKFNEDVFISNMPSHEEDSEAYFVRLNTMETIHHMYFSRTQAPEVNKTSYLLVHCNAKIEEDAYFDPENINVLLSSRATTLDFAEKSKVNEKVNIKDFIPKIYKISIPIEANPDDNRKSYAFYTSTKIQAIYENTMINQDYSNEELVQIFAVSSTQLKNEKGTNKIFYMKLFGAEQEINLRAETTESEIIYSYGNSRPYKTISQQKLNCGNSFYYIGSYSSLATDTYFFLEEIYGKYDLYYRNEILDSDEEIIFTNANKKYLVNSKIGNLTNSFDIIELKCQNPGYFNLHLLKNYYASNLVLYQRQLAIVQKGRIYVRPSIKEGQTKVYVEISTPLGKEIQIKTDKINTKIDATNRFFQAQYTNDTLPQYFTLTVAENDTVISTRLTDNNLYEIVEGESAKVNEENILIKLKNEKTYKSVNVTIDRVFNNYVFTMFRGDINYGIDMLLSGYEANIPPEKNTINLVLSNPYLKSDSMVPDKQESPFYIAFHIIDTEGYQKGVNLVYNNIDTYEEWENAVIKTLPASENKKYSLKFEQDVKKLSLLYQSCGNSLKEINLYSYDDIINTFENKNRFNLGFFNNYAIPEQMGPVFINDEGNKYTGAQISLSSKEISQDLIKDLNNDENHKLSQNGKKLKWNGLKGAKEYTIYIFNQKHEDVKYIENICYLDSIKGSNTELKNESDPTYIGIYTTKDNYYNIKEEGVYTVTVVANLENDIPLKFIFKEYKYDSSSEPYDEDEDDNDNTLVIVLSVVIPIVIIIIGIIVFVLWRKRNKDIERDLPKEDDDGQALIRETVNTTTE